MDISKLNNFDNILQTNDKSHIKKYSLIEKFFMGDIVIVISCKKCNNKL
jgi:hypothetical protein